MKYVQQIMIPFTMILIMLFVTLNTISSFPLNDIKGLADVGTAISGFSTPAIGLFTSILLFITLTKQAESNRNQEVKNESDVIFSLINQMDDELKSFYTNPVKKNNDTKLQKTGLEGLISFSEEYKFEFGEEDFGPDLNFSSLFESAQIILLVDTFNLIEERVSKSNLSIDMKSLFEQKLASYYQCKLKNSLTILCDAFVEFKQTNEPFPVKIQKLVTRWNEDK